MPDREAISLVEKGFWADLSVGGRCLTGVMSEGVLTPDPRHRVARFVASARADLDDLADVSVGR